MVDSASVASFFGTDSAVVVFALLTESGASIHYYSYADASRGLVALKRPAGRSLWRCESPLVSPDGRWVVYNCFSPDFKQSEIYLQRLAPDSRALLLRDNAADPHWWRNPTSGEYLVVYCTEWGAIRDVFEEIDDIAADDVGKTYALRVNLASVDEQLPAVLNFTSDPAVLLNLPFRGGLSPSGRYLGTGYQYGYIYRF
jgi:hypothetical protein